MGREVRGKERRRRGRESSRIADLAGIQKCNENGRGEKTRNADEQPRE
jgi:hypothetical protein